MPNDTTETEKQSTDESYGMRLSVIRLLEQGLSGKDTALLLDISDGCVSRIKREFQENGFTAFSVYQKEGTWSNEIHEIWHTSL